MSLTRIQAFSVQVVTGSGMQCTTTLLPWRGNAGIEDRMRIYQEEPVEYSVRLYPGNTVPLTGKIGHERILIRDGDPLLREVTAGEVWIVRVTEFIRNGLWAAELMKAAPNPPQWPIQLPVAVADRFVKDLAPAHLRAASETIGDTIDLIFIGRDHKGWYGHYAGIVLRLRADNPDSDFIVCGQVYTVTVCAVCTSGLYVKVIGEGAFDRMELNRPPRFTDWLPAHFEVCFSDADGEGVFGIYEGFTVRPNYDWTPRPTQGQTAKVFVVRVFRDGRKEAFVVPSRTN